MSRGEGPKPRPGRGFVAPRTDPPRDMPDADAWIAHVNKVADAVLMTTAERLLLDGHAEEIAGDLLAERVRQITEEGYSVKHDERHSVEDLARAGASYAAYCGGWFAGSIGYRYLVLLWPFDWPSFKPKATRRSLVIAGALIIAAIERHDRGVAIDADHEAG